MSIATRPATDVGRALRPVDELPVVEEAKIDTRYVGGEEERVAVVVLMEGIERVPPEVCRKIGEGDFGIDSIEEYPEHREVVLR